MELKHANTDEVLAAMRMGVEYVFEVRCRDFVVAVRPISVRETLEVAGAISRDMAALKSEIRTGVHEAYLVALHTLQRATRIPFDSKVEGPLAQATIDRFTPAELITLFEQYRDGIARIDPAIEDISVERMQELAEHVKKNGASVLTGLSRKHLEKLALFSLTRDDGAEGKSSGG